MIFTNTLHFNTGSVYILYIIRQHDRLLFKTTPHVLFWMRMEQGLISGSLRGWRTQDPECIWQNSSVWDQECPVNGQLTKFNIRSDKRNIPRRFYFLADAEVRKIFEAIGTHFLRCLYEEVEITASHKGSLNQARGCAAGIDQSF